MGEKSVGELCRYWLNPVLKTLEPSICSRTTTTCAAHDAEESLLSGQEKRGVTKDIATTTKTLLVVLLTRNKP